MNPHPLDGFNLKLLRVFEAVARHGSFSRAAIELARSAATISEQIRDLELQLNVRLLERTTRKVKLTQSGQILAASLSNGFSAIAEGVAAMRNQSEDRRLRLPIACVPSLSSVRLPQILAGYRIHDQMIRIEVHELTSDEIMEAVATDVVEFGIGPCADPPPPGVGFTPVSEEALHALLPRHYTAEGARALPFRALAAMPLVMLSGSVLLQTQLAQAAAACEVVLKPQTEVRHVQTAIAMAAAGVGVAIVPRLALPEMCPDNTISLPIIEPVMMRRVGIITRRGHPLRPAAARLARYVSATLALAAGQARATPDA